MYICNCIVHVVTVNCLYSCFFTLFPRLEHPSRVDMCALQIFIIIIIIHNF